MRFILSLLMFVSSLTASCVSKINIDFNFDKQTIFVKSKIYDSKKSIQMDTSAFNIYDMDKLRTSIQNGENILNFSYERKIKGLNKKYISLLNDWYPKIFGTCKYSITTSLDQKYISIYEDTQNEIDKVTFIASKKFVINSKKFNDITIETYFFSNDYKLSSKYINKSIEYIKLYEKTIGAYPYEKFRIVENTYSTGYSMPTYTLIGSRLLNKPYVLNQSLGHEILHQYFGNSIFNDSHKGNWVEGLTTFLADDYYKELKNTDVGNRKTILNEYENFVNIKDDFPISKFHHRYDKKSMIIGYSKMSFVFYMLRNEIGSKRFDEIIKKLYKEYRFKNLSLSELTLFFNKHTKNDLNDFFNQWLYKKGRIDYTISNVSNYYDSKGYWLSFNVVQKSENFFKFNLPIAINTYDEKINTSIQINKNNQNVLLNFDSEILDLIIDKDMELFRKLTKNEELLSIAVLMNQKNIIAVINKSDKSDKQYNQIKNIFPNSKIVYSDELTFNDIKQNTILFLDIDNTHLKHFYPNINISKEDSFLLVKQHIYNKDKQMAVMNFGKYKSRYLSMLKHYSKYKEIILKKDEIIKNMDSSDNGLKIVFNKIPQKKKIIKDDDIKSIYEDIKDKKIIYVGESHDKFEHHLNQLRVIKALHKNGKKVSIAMEMFQTPFQKDLDEYILGKTTLEEFLENSEYFKRWKFDYNLYKPIIDYAKVNKLPIVALNIDRNVTQTVSKKGLFSLNKQQKSLLPKKIDQSNLKYKESLNNIFEGHIPKDGNVSKHSTSKINLDFFYQSQLIWDEIMAENIHKYIKDKKDTVLVVIAGSGHVMGHNGIPSRVYYRNALPYSVVLNDSSLAKTGDIVIKNITKTKIKKQLKLGAYLKNGEELIVLRTVKDSFSHRVGIMKNDKIVEINGKKVNTLPDIKRVLYFIENINTVKIKVQRNKNIKELEID